MTPLKNGMHVHYYGSLTEYHGLEFTVERADPETPTYIGTPENAHEQSDDGHRYLLVPADPSVMVSYSKATNYLWNVRRQSFTVAE
jgi:hypothetical protein